MEKRVMESMIPMETTSVNTTLPEWRVSQIQSLWKTRADSFSRHQLRVIIKMEQAKRAEAW